MYSLMLKWRFKDRIQLQMDAFLKVRNCQRLTINCYIHCVQGFSEIIPLHMIKVFDEKELEVSFNTNHHDSIICYYDIVFDGWTS